MTEPVKAGLICTSIYTHSTFLVNKHHFLCKICIPIAYIHQVSYVCVFKAIKLDVQIRPVFTHSVTYIRMYTLNMYASRHENFGLSVCSIRVFLYM